MIIAEYIWLDVNMIPRSKSRTLFSQVFNISDLPIWNYDGSSTGQADTSNSEVELHPVAMFKDPFRKGDNILVLCEAKNNTISVMGNNRTWANDIFNSNINAQPWFGLEQEYFICNDSNQPLGHTTYKQQGPYYCSVGEFNYGRKIADDHYNKCIYAGVNISGINAEVAPGQWEFQIGPCLGIEAGDHMWMARYLLYRVAEEHNVVINFHPKPFPNVNGSGCHCNFSTKEMRESPNAETIIMGYMEKLNKYHTLHIEKYGEFNNMRLIGTHETSSMTKFSFGVGDRTASVRIPTSTCNNRRGYIEDRRPASNCDPYLVTGLMFYTYNL